IAARCAGSGWASARCCARSTSRSAPRTGSRSRPSSRASRWRPSAPPSRPERGALRWVRRGGREVLRAIYFALRAENWVTITPELEGLEIEAEPASFRIRFRARPERGPVKNAWEGRISGRSDGGIEFAVKGEAGSSFLRNRLGLCLFHPVGPCAGRPCIIETVDGDRAESAFPARVAPHQPLRR